jgi:hypothetical protein
MRELSQAQAWDLVKIWVDREQDLLERDDAAESLAASSDPASEMALVDIARDLTEDEILLDTCGTSLGERWAREGRLDTHVLASLSPVAKRIAEATIQTLAPELLRARDS